MFTPVNVDRRRFLGVAALSLAAVPFGPIDFAKPKPRRGAEDLRITYPIAIDSNYGIWHAFENE